jgi:uncharacterized protein YjbJ (UPF0337 family)
MNWERIEGNWRQLGGIAREQWGRLTANYVGMIAGKRQQVLGEIQAEYGVTKEANEKRLAEWLVQQHKVDPIHK